MFQALILSALLQGMPAGTFSNNVGVNTHFDHTDGQWANSSYLLTLARSIGFKWIRSSLTILPGPSNSYANVVQQFDDNDAPDAIRSTEISGNANWTAQNVINATTVWGVSYFENPNEFDLNDVNWIADDQKMMTVNRIAASHWPGIKTIAPSLAFQDPALLGDNSTTVDYANMHDYTGNYNPETAGWGGDVYKNGTIYGSLAYNVKAAQRIAKTLKPVISTEFGYSSFAGTLSEYTQAAYIQRAMLNHAAYSIANPTAPIAQQYLYDLVDEGGTTKEGFWGLARTDGSFKPSAQAVQNLLRLTADSGTPVKSCTLNATITSDQPIETVIFCNSSGEKIAAIWRPTPIQDPTTFAAITNPAANVSITFNEAVTNKRVYIQDCNYNLSSTENPASYIAFDRPIFVSVDGQATSRTFPSL
jgi:hypothetical protein